MKTIKKFATLTGNLKNAEHYEFYYEIIRFVRPVSGSLGDLEKLWNTFEYTFNQEDDVYKHSAKAGETKYIKEANAERKNAFTFIKMTIETALRDTATAKKDAAGKLSGILDNYRKILTAPMVDTSALVTNMLQELRQSAHAAALATLGLAGATDELEALNEKFIDLYAEREKSRGDAERRGTMKEVRLKTDKVFAKFAQALEMSYLIALANGNTVAAELSEKIIDTVNDTVKQYEAVYAHRGGATTGKNKPGGGDDDDDDGLDLFPSLPDEGSPTLAVASQETPSGALMRIFPANVSAFVQALYPAAQGGELTLLKTGEAPLTFPITGFQTVNSGGTDTVTGLEVAPPSEQYVFDSPFYNEGPCQAWAGKDGEELARFKGMNFPGMMHFEQ
jgi:hypothetical protein